MLEVSQQEFSLFTLNTVFQAAPLVGSCGGRSSRLQRADWSVYSSIVYFLRAFVIWANPYFSSEYPPSAPLWLPRSKHSQPSRSESSGQRSSPTFMFSASNHFLLN